MKPLMLQERRLLARRAGGAFTLVELLVVIGIIALLIGILIPVVGKVRAASRNAAAQAQVSALKTAIDRYYSDFKAYPGPVSNATIAGSGGPADDIQPPPPGGTVLTGDITMSENLVLGLLGGLRIQDLGGGAYEVTYDPALVGRGPMSMNLSQPKRYEPYSEGAQLSWSDSQGLDGVETVNGVFADDASSIRTANSGFDSVIPEFVDPYPNPMPILYFRANRGAQGVVSDAEGWGGGAVAGPFQYDLSQNGAYLKADGQGFYIGVGKDVNLANFTTMPTADKIPHGISTVPTGAVSLQKGQPGYTYPYNAIAYFTSPNSTPTVAAQPNATGTPRAKDTYILIAAGADRVYGTEDDITSFGAVVP